MPLLFVYTHHTVHLNTLQAKGVNNFGFCIYYTSKPPANKTTG